MKLYLQTVVEGRVEDVFHRFDHQLFDALTPAPLRKQIKRFDGCHLGDRFHFKTFAGDWLGVISERHTDPQESFFVDEGVQLPFPLVYWRHRHVVRSSKEGTLIIEDVEYRTKNALIDVALRPVLWCFFKARQPIYRRYFQESSR